MSGLVLNEKLIDKNLVKKTTIKVKRITHINMGVRVWFQIMTDDHLMYQRWSMLMNPSDEVLLLAKAGDQIAIEYIDDVAEDNINQTFDPFMRRIILSAKYATIV